MAFPTTCAPSSHNPFPSSSLNPFLSTANPFRSQDFPAHSFPPPTSVRSSNELFNTSSPNSASGGAFHQPLPLALTQPLPPPPSVPTTSLPVPTVWVPGCGRSMGTAACSIPCLPSLLHQSPSPHSGEAGPLHSGPPSPSKPLRISARPKKSLAGKVNSLEAC